MSIQTEDQWHALTGGREFQRRDDEDAREQRWTEFVAWVKQANVRVLLRTVADVMDDRTDPFHTPAAITQRLQDFAETEKWSGVLAAISRAMREAGQ